MLLPTVIGGSSWLRSLTVVMKAMPKLKRQVGKFCL
jgi:hypothetical protein